MQSDHLKRREFITLVGGAAVCWSLPARSQQGRMRRVGVLMGIPANDPESQIRLGAFAQGLQEKGWTVGQNVHIEYRWGSGSDSDHVRKQVDELIALAPDVIMAASSAAVSPMLQATRTIPIVFTTVADPVGAGYVDSLAHPGGNITGFINFEYAIGGKWLNLLKEIAPGIARVGVLRESSIPAGAGQFGAIQAAAATIGVEPRPIDVRDATEIERAITALAREPHGGLIVTGSPAAATHRALVVALAVRHRLPAIYNARFYATSGGLISYGPDFITQYRGAAGYVDRILRGEKPADLPVQTPTRYELVINLKAAKALDLTVPATLLSTADEVIE